MRAPVAPHNLALLKFIRQHEPVGTYDAFSVFEGGGESVKAFGHRLAYLKLSGWLINDGSTFKGIWRVTEQAVALIKRGPCQVPDKPADNDYEDAPGAIVPPRRIDVMNGPLYRPAAMSYRDGALDFAACPSITAGRAVPFKAEQESKP